MTAASLLSAVTAAPRGLPRERSGRATKSGGLWVLAFAPRSSPATTRSEVAAALGAARVARFGWLVLHTCRRLEVMGSGPRPSPSMLAALTGVPTAAEVDELSGHDAARHVLRLAAGLESSVVGEDQVLGQVRRLRRSADATPQVDGRLVGLLDLAIHVGATARRERPRVERSLADRGLTWLQTRIGTLSGAHVLVVGSGPIGREAARLATRAGASLTVASRGPARGDRVASRRVSLAGAAARLARTDAVVVALAGPWSDVLDAHLGGVGARPDVVDLSDPPAIPGPVRARLGGRLATLEDLAQAPLRDDAVTRAYTRHAETLVAEALDRLAWRSDPHLGDAIGALHAQAEARRTTELTHLLGRLPDLSARERTAIERFSRRLTSGVLHAPTLALHDQLAARRDDP